jgi:hypothetical protein
MVDRRLTECRNAPEEYGKKEDGESLHGSERI